MDSPRPFESWLFFASKMSSNSHWKFDAFVVVTCLQEIEWRADRYQLPVWATEFSTQMICANCWSVALKCQALGAVDNSPFLWFPRACWASCLYDHLKTLDTRWQWASTSSLFILLYAITYTSCNFDRRRKKILLRLVFFPQLHFSTNGGRWRGDPQPVDHWITSLLVKF